MAKHETILSIALCADGGAPAQVQLLPAGPQIVGRDGRNWIFDEPAARDVIAAFSARGVDLPLDWEHASQHRAPNGLDAPAAGWITNLHLRDGQLWGDVSWTERGAAQVAAREYRYLSPVFDYSPTTGRIAQLVGAGLTNQPNLYLQSINREESPMTRSASLVAAITSALGLAAEANDDAIATAINQLKAQADDALARATNAEQAQPSLERYVPRADYDTLATRATNAERALAEHQQAEHAAAVDQAIDGALKAGKITPATADYHRAMCSTAEGLARFREFADAAPEIGADAGLAGKRAEKPQDSATALNAEEIAICRATGITPEEFIATRDNQEAVA